MKDPRAILKRTNPPITVILPSPTTLKLLFDVVRYLTANLGNPKILIKNGRRSMKRQWLVLRGLMT